MKYFCTLNCNFDFLYLIFDTVWDLELQRLDCGAPSKHKQGISLLAMTQKDVIASRRRGNLAGFIPALVIGHKPQPFGSISVVRPFRVVHEAKASHYISNQPHSEPFASWHCEPKAWQSGARGRKLIGVAKPWPSLIIFAKRTIYLLTSYYL